MATTLTNNTSSSVQYYIYNAYSNTTSPATGTIAAGKTVEVTNLPKVVNIIFGTTSPEDPMTDDSFVQAKEVTRGSTVTLSVEVAPPASGSEDSED